MDNEQWTMDNGQLFIFINYQLSIINCFMGVHYQLSIINYQL